MPGPGKKLSKSDLREDQFLEWLVEASDYVRERAQVFVAGAVVLVVLAVIAHLIIESQKEARLDAAVMLGDVWLAEEQARGEVAVQLTEELAEEYEGTPAAERARLILANRYFGQERYDEARQLYQAYLDDSTGPDVLVFGAWRGLAACLEARGQIKEAAATYQDYATRHATTMHASLALLEAARCHGLAGDDGSRKEVLERIVQEFPKSPLVPRAREELGML